MVVAETELPATGGPPVQRSREQLHVAAGDPGVVQIHVSVPQDRLDRPPSARGQNPSCVADLAVVRPGLAGDHPAPRGVPALEHRVSHLPRVEPRLDVLERHG